MPRRPRSRAPPRRRGTRSPGTCPARACRSGARLRARSLAGLGSRFPPRHHARRPGSQSARASRGPAARLARRRPRQARRTAATAYTATPRAAQAISAGGRDPASSAGQQALQRLQWPCTGPAPRSARRPPRRAPRPGRLRGRAARRVRAASACISLRALPSTSAETETETEAETTETETDESRRASPAVRSWAAARARANYSRTSPGRACLRAASASGCSSVRSAASASSGWSPRLRPPAVSHSSLTSGTSRFESSSPNVSTAASGAESGQDDDRVAPELDAPRDYESNPQGHLDSVARALTHRTGRQVSDAPLLAGQGRPCVRREAGQGHGRVWGAAANSDAWVQRRSLCNETSVQLSDLSSGRW